MTGGDVIRETIEYDNSFSMSNDNNTSFTLRGNASVFHHYYEHTRCKNKTPVHQITCRLAGINTPHMYDAFISEIHKRFDEKDITVRELHDIDIRGPEFDFDTDLVYFGRLFNIENTDVTMYCSAFKSSMVVEVFVGSNEEKDKFFDIFKAVNALYEPMEEEHVNKFYMITHDGNSLDLLEYDIKKSKIENFNIEIMYNDDFVEVDEKIKRELNSDGGMNGIVLLHGIYGSGKTTYIRHLISQLNKRVIYMPPDMASQLAAPSFFNFIRNYPDSILVIEDAETILKRRIEGGTAAISNLLNLSDGIMGDALNIQVVCTFNADIDEIDEALLRPGRLIANYYFDTLTKDKTEKFVKYVYGEDAEPTKPTMTVAEVYNMNEKQYNSEKPKRKYGIGFTASLGPG